MRRGAFGFIAVLVLFALQIRAQESLPNDLEALLKNTRFAGADHDIVRRWLDSQMLRIPESADAKSQDYQTAFKGFVGSNLALIARPDVSQEFRIELASVAAGLGVELFKGLATPWQRAVPLAELLVELDDPACVPGFLAGLESPHQGVRLLAVLGLLKRQPEVSANANLKKTVIEALENIGVKEPSDVVRRKIYDALFAFHGRMAAALPSLLKVLDGRVQRAREGALATGFDDESLLQIFLSERANLSSDQSRQDIVARIAPLLRRWSDRLQQGGGLPFEEAEAIRRALVAAEELLETFAGTPGAIRSAIDQGGENAPKRIGEAVTEWIGNESTSGVLNKAPWNVAPGAP